MLLESRNDIMKVIKEEKKYKPANPKTIAYDYLYNYFGKDTFKGKIITGACVQLAIRVYKDDKEVKFIEEPKYEHTYFSDIYKVSIDRNKLFTICKNLRVDKLFRLVFGWDKIESNVVGYTLDYQDSIIDLPGFNNIPYLLTMEVSEKDFRDFLSMHIDDFDIPAQVLSVSYI